MSPFQHASRILRTRSRLTTDLEHTRAADTYREDVLFAQLDAVGEALELLELLSPNIVHDTVAYHAARGIDY